MIDWLSDHAWVTWVGIAVVLAVVELMSLDLVLLMFALGALGCGRRRRARRARSGCPCWCSPSCRRRCCSWSGRRCVERLHAGPTLQTGHQNLVGRDALVIEPVDSRSGRVKLASEVWSARADGDESFDTGVEVRVIRIDGATAVVTGKES